MNEHDIVLEWLQIAYDDYDSAKFLFDNKIPKPLEIICYHCQQSVEKSLKGYLCSKEVEFKFNHQTGVLCKQCAQIDPDFNQHLEDCDNLTIYAAETRYPIRIEIDESHVKRAIQQAFDIYTLVSSKVNRQNDDSNNTKE
jgi:HEPN domain-containing protein